MSNFTPAWFKKGFFNECWQGFRGNILSLEIR